LELGSPVPNPQCSQTIHRQQHYDYHRYYYERVCAAAANAAAAVAVDFIVALRRPLGSVSAGVCALDLFGRLVAHKEEESGRGDTKTLKTTLIVQPNDRASIIASSWQGANDTRPPLRKSVDGLD
jgi:hypothetical protein